MDDKEIGSLLPEIVDIARQAGEQILAVYATDFEVQTKADTSPLTAADLAAHDTIVAGLRELTPDWPILSEESAEIGFEIRSGWSHYWLVDPLDGTREFVERNGEFTVNIALIDNHRPVLGVVHVPVSGRDYYACKESGAWRKDPGEEPVSIQASSRCQRPVRIVGSKSHRGSSLNAFLEYLGEYEFIPMGSSLKICLVADGSADVYPRLGPTSEWDTAAAQAIVEIAGGQMTDIAGKAIRYNRKADLLNPFFLVFGDSTVDWPRLLASLSPPAWHPASKLSKL